MKRFLSFFLLLILFSVSYWAQAQAPAVLPPLVHVTGTGEVKVQPDEVVLNIGVEVRDKDLEAVRRQSDERVAALLNYLKKSGVDAKDIQTTNLSLYPSYRGEYGQTTPEFYIAQRSVSVVIKNVKKFDEILTGVYKTGANRVDGIEYRTSELAKHREKARKLAIQAAKEKAITLTRELGNKIGPVYRIDETSSGGLPGPLPIYGRANKMMEASAADAGGPTIAVGQIIVSSSVDVSFIIE